MKRQWFFVSAFLTLALVGLLGCSTSPLTSGNSQGTSSDVSVNLTQQQQGIWVSGKGSVTVVPDVAVLTLGIEAQDKTVAAAQAQAVAAMNQVMSALTGNGVNTNDIKTQYFTIQQVTRYDQTTQQEVVVGYRVVNKVTAKIRQMEKAGTVIDAVATAGGDLTRIDYISFTVDNPDTYNDQLRQKAMEDAKTKAGQLAGLGGVTLGKPTFISESTVLPPIPAPIFRGPAEGKTPISPGETELTLTVQVVYSILS